MDPDEMFTLFFAGRDFWSWRCIAEVSAVQSSARHVTIFLEAICQSKLVDRVSIQCSALASALLGQIFSSPYYTSWFL